MKTQKSIKIKKNAHARDFTKMNFNGEKYGKGRVVLAIVSQYVKDHPGIDYGKLKEIFPDTLHSLGVIRPLYVAKKLSMDHKRFFVDNVLRLQDKAIAVCADFGRSNINKFLKHASGLGYTVRAVIS